ncbi:integrin alpha-M isoform X2 [Salarias fasciatus]|uniref:Integrin alpha-M-like n=1 Tax=Salarias fasciatus TaxID=181472 RepID=A0A672FEF4_SALFA|nr:integrin alpha-M-like isoform X2 [Salarias fasciatus]
MARPKSLHLLAVLLSAAATVHVSVAFNIDLSEPEVYEGEPQDFFGYKVLQFKSGSSKGIVVTSPLRMNGSGGVSRLTLDQKQISLQERSLPNAMVAKHLGLSIAADSTGSHFTVCSPNVEHECYENSYLNSICYNITEDMEEVSSFTPAFQDCTKKTVDLVFLFDGSNSMTTKEFEKNKEFILDIMKSLGNSSIKFAAVQFSTEFRKVFDFNDYKAGLAEEKLWVESHMKTLTNTHGALTFVLHELFENPGAGASPDATKVLVLITDGDPSDIDRNKTIHQYDVKNVIRFVIGVKKADLSKFKAIASEPKDQNSFKIENYDGLTGVLENFQKKIFNMEGSTAAQARNMTDEMSQSGFSAAIYQDKLILGSVGSNTWQGALLERQERNERQIEDPEMTMDSYMGYSISVGERNGVAAYFTGAPRFEHRGRVVLFKHDGRKWTVAGRLTGEQIGSYFGAELCSVDVDSDGNTDFLLVGAPLFYQPQDKKEGHVYVYQLTEEMQLKAETTVAAPSIGRFGSTISSLADLNGDGLRDVAVGAPLEDDNSGAVYIYLGDRTTAVRRTYSQRIMGATVNPGRRFFGQAISGDLDLGQDGLPDVVVGSQGAAVVLRSKPVFNVEARMSFHPEEISTDGLDCPSQDDSLPMVELQVCFQLTEVTRREAGDTGASLNITYMLDVDPKRLKNRGFFMQEKKKSRNLTSSYELTEAEACFNYTVHMPKCLFDTVSSVSIKLNFSQTDSASSECSLNTDSLKHTAVEVPFKKQCRNNDSCVAELDVDFSFMTDTLLVTEDSYFNMSVTLHNHGDDSYNTSLTMLYPLGLSFSMMTLAKASRPTLHSCSDLQGVLDKTVCGVSLPVYRSRSSATFNTSFLIISDYDWSDTVSMTVAATSDNTNSTVNLTRSIPVQFEVKMALTVKEDSVSYLNFTPEHSAPKKLSIVYKIDNIGFKDFPVNVSLIFPTKLQHGFEMSSYKVSVHENKTRCTSTKELRSELCPAENHCVSVMCETFSLNKDSEFQVSGDVHFKDLKQLAANAPFLKRYTGDGGEVKFSSFIQVDYDTQRYVLEPNGHQKKGSAPTAESRKRKHPVVQWTEVRVEFILPPDQLLIILTGAGLGFLLLIVITLVMFKLGCFKRKTQEYYEEQEEKAALQAATPTELVPAAVNGKADDQPLLGEDGLKGGQLENGGSVAADGGTDLQ